MINVLFNILFAADFHLAGFYREICSEHSTGNPSAVTTMAEMASPVTREKLRVVNLDGNGATQTVSFHEVFGCRRI
jgi:hypothetical protein